MTKREISASEQVSSGSNSSEVVGGSSHVHMVDLWESSQEQRRERTR